MKIRTQVPAKPDSEESGEGIEKFGPTATLVLAMLMPCSVGCRSGVAGEPCSSEYGCKYGYRCHSPSGASRSVCTAVCPDDSCPDGACAVTSEGEFCTRACEDDSNCPNGLDCFPSPSEQNICWTDDLLPSPQFDGDVAVSVQAA